MSKFGILALTVTLFVMSCSTASKLKRGDKFYDKYSYNKAIDLYKKVAKKGDESVYRKIADSYRRIHAMDSAETWYSRVMNSTSKESVDMYYYAEVLKYNKKYEDADAWMKKYNSNVSADTRPSRKLEDPNYVKKLSEDKGEYLLKNLDINSEQSDFGPIFYKDSQIVFTSSREGVQPVVRRYNWNEKPFLDLYVAKMDTAGNLLDPDVLHHKYNSKFHEGLAAFNADYSEIYFSRNNYYNKNDVRGKDGSNNLQIYYAKIKDGEFQDEDFLPFNNDDFRTEHPALTADGKTLYFSSDRPGGKGGMDLYKSQRLSDGTWSEPINLGPEINTEGNEVFPFIHKTNVLYFASDGHLGLGGLDVYSAAISQKDRFSKITNLGFPINTSSDDFSYVIDDNLKNGYLSSNRPGGKGDDDIYSFVKLTTKYEVCGISKEKNTGERIPDAEISLLNDKGEILETKQSDSLANYCFEVDPETKYSIVGKKPRYFDGTKDFDTYKIENGQSMKVDVELERIPDIRLCGIVKDKVTGEMLEGVHVVLHDNMTDSEALNIKTGAGEFCKPITEKKIGDRLSYQVILEKEGYLGKKLTFNHEIKKPGVIRLEEYLDVDLDKLEIGTDIGKLIDINPIYFDLNKHDIRPDAAAELDKIVTVMNENPTIVIELGSHTDSRGSDEYNRALSDRRAKSSAAYIVSKGISKERIYGKGYGETQLVNHCKNGVKCSADDHQANRRTEFKIVKM